MKTATINLYQFSELTGTARDNALMWWRQAMGDDWHESVTDDFKTILGEMGFSNIETYFSGFWSQGDGASFSADFTYRQDAQKAVQDYAPIDTRLYDLAGKLPDCEESITLSQSRYCHEMKMQCDNEALLDVARDLARWYYGALSDEYEYATSESACEDSCHANDYSFTEEGRFHC